MPDTPVPSAVSQSQPISRVYNHPHTSLLEHHLEVVCEHVRQASDHRGAALMLPQFSTGAQELIADRGYDSFRFCEALTARGITPRIPSTRSRKQPIPHGALLYRQRHRIEIMFGRLKDWRRIAMRYDGRAHTFFSAIALAATVTFWLNQ